MGPREGKGEVANSEFVPFAGDHPECRGYESIPPSCGPQHCLLRGPKEGKNTMEHLHSRGSPAKGTKSELATSPLPSRWPTNGQNYYLTPAFSGGPRQRGQNQNWLPHPCLLRGATNGLKLLRNACILRGPQQRGQNQNWVPHPCLLGGPTHGLNYCVTHTVSGVLSKGF